MQPDMHRLLSSTYAALKWMHMMKHSRINPPKGTAQGTDLECRLCGPLQHLSPAATQYTRLH